MLPEPPRVSGGWCPAYPRRPEVQGAARGRGLRSSSSHGHHSHGHRETDAPLLAPTVWSTEGPHAGSRGRTGCCWHLGSPRTGRGGRGFSASLVNNAFWLEERLSHLHERETTPGLVNSAHCPSPAKHGCCGLSVCAGASWRRGRGQMKPQDRWAMARATEVEVGGPERAAGTWGPRYWAGPGCEPRL